MTDEERKMLTDLADRIASTPPPPRDPDAEQLIRTRIGSRPDALYLMTQTVLIQNLALQQAQQQLQQLRSQSGQVTTAGSSAGGSFLGGASARPSQGQYSAPPPPQYAAPAPAGPSPSVSGSGAGSFLRGAAQTAAGVAAGALAFEGIEHLFSHPSYGGSGFFGGGGIGGYGQPAEENIVNNYYDNGPQGDNGGNFGQDDYQAADDSANAPDDQQFDDSSNLDDGSNFDDGGGFDGGGGDNFV